MPKFKVIVKTATGKKSVIVDAPDKMAAEQAAVKECSK